MPRCIPSRPPRPRTRARCHHRHGREPPRAHHEPCSARARPSRGSPRAHAELVSEGHRAPVVGLGFLPVGRIAAREHLAEEAEGIDLVAALLVPPSEVERVPPAPRRLLDLPPSGSWNARKLVKKRTYQQDRSCCGYSLPGSGIPCPVRVFLARSLRDAEPMPAMSNSHQRLGARMVSSMQMALQMGSQDETFGRIVC